MANLSKSASSGQFAPPTTVAVAQIHGTGDQSLIVVPVDRLTLILYENADALDSRRAWIAPLGIAITLVITLLTADFKDLWVSPEMWKAGAILSTIGSVMWLAKELLGLKKAKSIREIVQEIKDHQTRE